MKAPPGRSPERVELDRILALPVREAPDEADVEIASFEELTVEAFSRGERLLPGQVHGLRAWREAKGAVVPLLAGSGKTGLSLLIIKDALARRVARKVLWIVPVNLTSSLLSRHVPEWRQRVGLPFAIHSFARLSPALRARLAASNAPGAYLFPYSLLSTSDTVDLLAALDADLVVADEAHRLKRVRGAAWHRLAGWMASREERPPGLVTMSGTLTSKSVMEYHHLSEMALGPGSPLPRQPSVAFQWSMVVDSEADPLTPLRHGLKPLLRWADPEGRLGDDRSAFRTAFQRRLRTVPGVAASDDDGRPAASLSLLLRAPEPGPSPQLQALVKKVDDYYTPEDEPIDHAIHCWGWQDQLSAGFYNSLRWPSASELAARRSISEEESNSILGRAQDHLRAQQVYHRALRRYFSEDAVPGLDTPREVGRAIQQGKVGGELAQLWHAVRALDFPGRPDRDSRPVRVCDHKVRAAVEWARHARKGIVWTWNVEVGLWVWEALRDAGLDPLHAPAGKDEVVESVGDPGRGGKGDRLVVASLKAHGVGRNLQAFDRCLYVQWPQKEDVAEQGLARLHRTGQLADEVETTVLVSTEHDRMALAVAINDAVYVQQTMATPRRLLYCDYDPMPDLYPPEFLRERGGEPRMLDAAGREFVVRRFGGWRPGA